MDLVLFGIQGSGKGTQSKIIAEKCDLAIFEAGGELRRLASEDSDLGKKVKNIMEAGHLVPTEVVMEIIENFFHHLPKGKNVLFDGIPRSKDQQEQFDALMKKEGREFKGLLIELSEEEAMKRLTTRRMCVNCKAVYPATYSKSACEACGGELVTRQDDNPEAIRVRLATFFEKTTPVIESYQSQGLMLTVKGEQEIDRVTEDALGALKPFLPCLE